MPSKPDQPRTPEGALDSLEFMQAWAAQGPAAPEPVRHTTEQAPEGFYDAGDCFRPIVKTIIVV